MKRIIHFFLLTLMVVWVAVPFGAAAKGQTVLDAADLLSAQEEAVLAAKLEQISDTYQLDVAVVTEAIPSNPDPQAAADDIYDYSGYGIGENYSGILLYVCMDTRQYAFTTCGDAIPKFNGNAFQYMESQVIPSLSAGQYNAAFTAFGTACENVLGGHYRKPLPLKTAIFLVALIFGIPLFFAFKKTKDKESKMHTANIGTEASAYVKQDSFHLTQSRDVFVYSTVTRTAKPKNNGSGTHTSSSGRSHGGSSGGF